ncbi:MAG: hypothetical protein R6V83_03680 [Candidatus Thorarchaeota archaeon]
MTSEENEDWQPQSGLDVLLMLLYAPEHGEESTPVKGITRLDKLVFLLSRFDEFEGLFKDDYDFVPYNFGPFATELLDDLEALKSQKVISATKEKSTRASETRDAEAIDEETGELDDSDVTWDMYDYEVYRLTEAGQDIAKRIYSAATKEQREIVRRIKERFNQKSLTGLLRYVYKTYPYYAKESNIRPKILGRSA